MFECDWVPLQLSLVSHDEGLETENIDVSLVFQVGNDALGELSFLEDADQDGGKVLIFVVGFFVIVNGCMFVDFLSEFSHSFFTVSHLIDEGRIHCFSDIWME